LTELAQTGVWKEVSLRRGKLCISKGKLYRWNCEFEYSFYFWNIFKILLSSYVTNSYANAHWNTSRLVY